MKNIMQYKGYYGSIEIDNKDLIFYGKLEFIRALVSYEGESAKEIREAFENAVDDYLQICATENLAPEKPFIGSFNIRIGEELHEKATQVALDQNMKLRWSRYLVIDFSHPWPKSTRQRAKCLAPTVLRPARCPERASVCLPQ